MSSATGSIPSQHWATAEPKPSGPPAKAKADNRHVTFSATETPPAGVPQLCLVNTSRIATSPSAAQAAASSLPGQGGGLEGPSKGTLAVGSRGKEADPSKDEGYYGNIQPVIPYAWVHSDGWQPHPLPLPPGRVEGNRLAATSAASADLQQQAASADLQRDSIRLSSMRSCQHFLEAAVIMDTIAETAADGALEPI